MLGESVIYGIAQTGSFLCVITQGKTLLKNDISLSVDLKLNRTKSTRKSVIYGIAHVKSSLRVIPQRQSSLKNDVYLSV
jgi:hypothetical protein